jgi:ribosomal protein L7Ae-like RNA K-turn-binding protein
MEDNFHVDMSGRIYENRTIGIAMVGTETKLSCGCALKGNLIKLLKRKLFSKNIYQDSAKLYAICIFLLIEKLKDQIKSLIICNDEDFESVKTFLQKLLKGFNIKIISINEFRRELGRNIGSFADNCANIYRKKALKPRRWVKGKELNVVNVTFSIIKQYWEEIK